MRILLLLLFFISYSVSLAQAYDVRKQLEIAYALIKDNDLDSGRLLTEEALEYSRKTNHHFGLVKSHFYLGHIAKNQGDLGKSVILYLEGIRLSDEHYDKDLSLDMVKMRRNLANTYRRYKAYKLATKYNLEAIRIAEENQFTDQLISIKYNQGLIYQNEKNYELALKMYYDVMPFVKEEKLFKTLGSIGLTYLNQGNTRNAVETLEQLIDQTPQFHDLKARALNNLGSIAMKQGDTSTALSYIKKSIFIRNSVQNPDIGGVLWSYKKLSACYLSMKEYDKAEVNLNKAITLYEPLPLEPKYFKIFKIAADFYNETGIQAKSQFYLDKYYQESQKYMDKQLEVLEKDKEFNLELITKRYFDQIDKQEKLSTVKYYAGISTSGLILIILLLLSYHFMEKRKLRRSISNELERLELM